MSSTAQDLKDERLELPAFPEAVQLIRPGSAAHVTQIDFDGSPRNGFAETSAYSSEWVGILIDGSCRASRYRFGHDAEPADNLGAIGEHAL